jgi:hypothetical protein
VAVERSELELVWPADLFRREGQALLDAGNEDESTLGWLLAEAFHGERGYQLFTQTPEPWTGWGDDLLNGYQAPAPPQGPSPRALLVAGLVSDADDLPPYVPKRYYSARRNPRPEATRRTLAQTKTTYARVVVDLSRTGYFGDAFGSACVDDPDDPAEQGQKKLSSLLGTESPMWPLAGDNGELTGAEQDWSEDLFFDVVEALTTWLLGRDFGSGTTIAKSGSTRTSPAPPDKRSTGGRSTRCWPARRYRCSWRPTARTSAGWCTRPAMTATSWSSGLSRHPTQATATRFVMPSRCSEAASRTGRTSAAPYWHCTGCWRTGAR